MEDNHVFDQKMLHDRLDQLAEIKEIATEFAIYYEMHRDQDKNRTDVNEIYEQFLKYKDIIETNK